MEENAKELTLPTIRDAATAEDERLVQECLSGDEKAWNTLIDKYKRLIYSVPVKYGFSPDDAGDIFQNVCIDLFTNLSKLRKIESLRSWLITVATHKCFHWKKQQRGEVELGRDGAGIGGGNCGRSYGAAGSAGGAGGSRRHPAAHAALRGVGEVAVL